MVTLVTLAATHHSSRIDPLVLPHDVDDNRAALASMTHPVHVTASRQQSQPQQPTISPTVSAGGPGASAGDRAEAVAVGEHAHAATHVAAQYDPEMRAAVGATGAVEGEQAVAALEAAAAATAKKRRKQEVLEEKMLDEGYVQKLVAAAAEQVRNQAAGADAEGEETVALLAQTDGPSAAPGVEEEDDAVSPATKPSSPPLDPAPTLLPKDERFEDASWATDDYRTPRVSTKDPVALNRLQPVVSSPGPDSDKTKDPVMKQMFKKIEHAKHELAESSVDDDGAFNETAFIDELVREDVVLAPDEEPEASLKTNGGNYLSGEFDAGEMARIVSDKSKMDAADQSETVPVLEGDDVEDNVREEVPLAEPFDDEETEEAKRSETEVEKKEKAAAADEDEDEDADAPSSGPAAAPADEPSSAPAPDADYAPGPSSSRR